MARVVNLARRIKDNSVQRAQSFIVQTGTREYNFGKKVFARAGGSVFGFGSGQKPGRDFVYFGGWPHSIRFKRNDAYLNKKIAPRISWREKSKRCLIDSDLV